MVVRAGWTSRFSWLKHYPTNAAFFHHEKFSPRSRLSQLCLALNIVAQLGLQWTFWLTAENEPGRLCYQTALSDCALPPEGQAHDSPSCSVRRALPVLREVAREVAKHTAGWRSAAGGAERWISFPAVITSPKSFKMFVFKNKTLFFLCFFCHPLVQDKESFMFLSKKEEKKTDNTRCLKMA